MCATMPGLSYIYWIKCCIWNCKTELGLKARSWKVREPGERERVKSPTGTSATEGFSYPKSADSSLPVQGLKFRKAWKTVQKQYERKQQIKKTEVQAAELKTKDTPSLYLLRSSLRELRKQPGLLFAQCAGQLLKVLQGPLHLLWKYAQAARTGPHQQSILPESRLFISHQSPLSTVAFTLRKMSCLCLSYVLQWAFILLRHISLRNPG